MDIVTFPNLALRKKCTPVLDITTGVQEASAAMVRIAFTLQAFGLAAPQVGIDARLIVLRSTAGNYVPFINPEILWTSIVRQKDFEMCLSLPWLRVTINRPVFVAVRATALDGTTIEWVDFGTQARVVQHEIDHLDGVLLLDYLTGLQKGHVKNKLKRLVRGANAGL